ncbi:MAG: glucose-1-phosphate adenylyltransferase subunit GlgD [Lachnospiraceae bacterium]|nr:glucose-1-phosphate adenylyltransferase subunit GlgD [Lachnospiraceae bacterium]
MARAFGIIASSLRRFRVEGLQEHRPVSAFSFMGRYRVIDFPVSNMSNSGIDRIHVFVGSSKPRSLTEHLGTGRHYNINSKRGKLQMIFANLNVNNTIYNTDIHAYAENLDILSRVHEDYVVIAPNYMIYTQNYDELLQKHIDSGADITLLYHKVDNADKAFLDVNVLNLNRQKGVKSIEHNLGNAADRNIFMDTYVMSRELFVEIVESACKLSSAYSMSQMVSSKCDELDIRGVQHKGYFAAITDLKSYMDSNMGLLYQDLAAELISPNWPIYTKTTDAAPTQYYDDACVTGSYVSNGCDIEGTVENSIIGRKVKISKGAVVKNSIVLANAEIGPGVYVENQIVDKWAKIIHTEKIVSEPDKPGYIERDDII